MIIDYALLSLKKRFQLYANLTDKLGLLHNVHGSKKMNKEKQMNHCMKLQCSLQDQDKYLSDIEDITLYEELDHFSNVIPIGRHLTKCAHCSTYHSDKSSDCCFCRKKFF